MDKPILLNGFLMQVQILMMIMKIPPRDLMAIPSRKLLHFYSLHIASWQKQALRYH
jgi:hypothetical protein